MSDMASVYERHRITLDEYHRMAEAGVFDPGARIELIEGELVEMAPIYPPHASVVDEFNKLFSLRLANRARVRCQNPITLPGYSEPQPDIVLAKLVEDRYRARHPLPADIYLVVEVSDSSLEADRAKKIPLYARTGIAEVWLVNLFNNEIIAHREPTPAWYGSIRTYRAGDRISPEAFPDVALAVDDVLPPQ